MLPLPDTLLLCGGGRGRRERKNESERERAGVHYGGRGTAQSKTHVTATATTTSHHTKKTAGLGQEELELLDLRKTAKQVLSIPVCVVCACVRMRVLCIYILYKCNHVSSLHHHHKHTPFPIALQSSLSSSLLSAILIMELCTYTSIYLCIYIYIHIHIASSLSSFPSFLP
jgi:hypothetical protein